MKWVYIDWLTDKGIPTNIYRIYENGHIWSVESEQWLKPYVRKKDNYVEYDLKWDNKRYKAKAHQLTCRAFHGPPPYADMEPDHLNMDRTDNSASNLEWVTHEENMRRRNEAGGDTGGKDKKPIVVVNKEMQTALLFLSHKDAIEALNISAPTFYKRLANCDTVYGKTIYPVVNPEVINERNKRKQERESEPERAEALGEDSKELRPETEDYLSKTAKTVLDKWSKR